MTQHRKCRSCGAAMTHTFCDLGTSPLSNSNLEAADLGRMEPFYPLHAFVCGECFLVQLEQMQTPDKIFSNYAYFSSYSDSWLAHCRAFAQSAIERFGLGATSQVVEVASNDGYLLQYFKAKGVPVLGIEPAANVAQAAIQNGIPTLIRFFGTDMARELAGKGRQADLLIGNNVLAHVPAPNDFVSGLRLLLAPHGVVTMEFPHLLSLIIGNQFDTIYHEHFSYFSLLSATRLFEANGLTIFDVEKIPTHGGSLRIHARHAGDDGRPVSRHVGDLLAEEKRAKLDRIETYGTFSEKVKAVKRDLLELLIAIKREGKSIAGYGAAAKGNTLLNYCGIRTDFLDYVADRSPHKQHRFLPGTHIPIVSPDRIYETKPDYLLILPWNIKAEIMQQLSDIRSWGGQFVIPISKPTIVP